MFTVGVVGAGTMGRGIAQVAAQAALPTLIYDVNPDLFNHVKSDIGSSATKLHAKGISPLDGASVLKNITFTNVLDDLSIADLVIEAVPENESLKKDIFKSLSSILKDDAIVATNTSSMSITRLATFYKKPSQFLGVHFMNPVPVMPLVEIITGLQTADATYMRATDIIDRLGKKPIRTIDRPGFVVNRLLIPMINEAIFTLADSVATADDIDRAMQLGAGYPMGPLHLADFIGLDVCLAIMNVLYHEFKDPKYRPCPLLQQYVDAGWLGKKTGRGFFIYDA